MDTRSLIMVMALQVAGLGIGFGHTAAAERSGDQAVTSWPAPKEEKLSGDFTLRINGQAVPVYSCRVSAVPFNQPWPGHQRPLDQTELASFAYWDMSGPVTVQVSAMRPFQSVAVRPTSRGIRAKIKGQLITFQLTQPDQLTVELDGMHHALHLFADPPETSAPNPSDPNVLYFGPGVHRPGLINLRSGQTVYVAGGAVVYAAIHGVSLTGVRIFGRGILDNSEFPRNPRVGSIWLTNSTDVRIEGVILRDASQWGLACFGCRNVTISRIKEIGFWRYNTDGIDICNSQDVTISGSFVRSFDDSIVLKGENSWDGIPLIDRPVRNIRVINVVIWCDWGRALEIGAETQTPEVADVVFRDIDIIRTGFIAMDIQLLDRAAVHDIRYENIHFHVDDVSPQPLVQKGPADRYAPDPNVHYVPQLFMIIVVKSPISRDSQPGTVRGVFYKDIFVTGKPKPTSAIIGFDTEHDVRGVSIQNLRFNGKPATNAKEALLTLVKYAQPVRFE